MQREYDKIKIGRRIKELRIAKGFSQDELCDKGLDIEAGYLSKIECGKYSPSISLFVKIANALDTELDNIFDCQHLADEEELDSTFIESYKNLTLKKKRMLHRFMQILQEERE